MNRLVLLAAVVGLALMGACDTADTTAPSVSIVFPANGATVNKGDIVIKAVATDNKAVTKVEFYIAGALKGTDNVGGAGDTFRYTWSDTANQVVGQSYSLVAKAFDAADNTTSSAAITITIAGGGGGTGPTYHNTDISADETWYPSGNPHIVQAPIGVGNATLTIMPGCIVKFDPGTSIGMGWTINSPAGFVAVGKPDSVIVFTSNQATPAPGDWDGIKFWEGTKPESKMSYCKISYAGKADGQAIEIYDTHFSQFDHSTIRHSAGYGINIGNFGYALDISYDTIEQCGKYPIQIMPEHVGFMGLGNKFTPNTQEGILLPHGGVENADATWRNHGTPYVVSSDVWIGPLGGPSVTVTMLPGVTVKFAREAYLNVGTNGGIGALIADSVTFTSNAGTVQPGDWLYVNFGDGARSTSRLHNCTVEYGGKDGWGNIFISNSKPDIRGNNIGHSEAWGIYLEGELQYLPNPDSLEENNNFYDNTEGKVRRP